MLKITKSSQPIEVKTLVVVVYSPPGLGKTSMGFTAEKPLLLDFDKGSHRARNRRDVVRIETWGDVVEMTAEDFTGYSTVVVDTAGRALDVLAADIIKGNPKMGRGGALSLQGYGELKSKFTAWVKHVRSFGLDVVLLAHSDESRSGEDVIERLDVQGGSKGEIYKSADVMGRIYLANGRRTLNLSPTDTAFGKNPGQLPALDIPDYATSPDFLAGVISQTKAALNTLSEEQSKAAAALAEWADRIEKASTAEDFNGLIEPTKGADEAVRDNVKRLLVKASKAKGMTFDAKAGAFVAPVPAAETKKADAPAGGKTAEREPGADDDGEAANRAAATPTQAETEKLDAAAKTGDTGELPGVTEKPAKKGKAA
jgi:AAA domain-containing protein